MERSAPSCPTPDALCQEASQLHARITLCMFANLGGSLGFGGNESRLVKEPMKTACTISPLCVMRPCLAYLKCLIVRKAPRWNSNAGMTRTLQPNCQTADCLADMGLSNKYDPFQMKTHMFFTLSYLY